MVRASAPRAPSISSSGGAKRSTQRRPLSVPSSQRAAAAATSARATAPRTSPFSHLMAWRASKHETDREVQAPAFFGFAVRDVDADRADRGAEARAAADAEHRRIAAAVPGIAGVGEGGEPPGGREPVRVL